jgi:thioredoxin reductase
MYDVIIVGGGPAGITAAALALNQRLETLVVAERWGGQTTYAMELEEMEEREAITGDKLLDAFRLQLDYLDFVRRFDTVTSLAPEEGRFVAGTAHGDCFEARTLILATGAKPERLHVPGEARLAGRGLSYSATTHGSLFLGKDVAVVGKTERAQWAAADLARKAHRVHLLAPTALPDTPLAARLRETENVQVWEGTAVQEIGGDRYVEKVVVALPDGSVESLPVKGVFVKLARTPNSSLVRDWLECDEDGRVLVDIYCATSWPGAFAAGDVTHVSEQVLVHIGEGATAAHSAYHYVLVQ